MQAPLWSEGALDMAGTLTAQEVHTWRFDLDEELADEEQLLSTNEQRQLASLRRPITARRYKNTRIHLRNILARYLQSPPALLEFVVAPGGKPRLKHKLLEFNLSHSQGLGLLAISAKHPVGIDLEKIRDMKYAPGIARRMFPEGICKQLSHMNGEDRQLAFFRHWTAMEARQKALGRGIFEATVATAAMHCQHFLAAEGFVAAVATESVYGRPSVRFFNCPPSAYDAA